MTDKALEALPIDSIRAELQRWATAAGVDPDQAAVLIKEIVARLSDAARLREMQQAFQQAHVGAASTGVISEALLGPLLEGLLRIAPREIWPAQPLPPQPPQPPSQGCICSGSLLMVIPPDGISCPAHPNVRIYGPHTVT